MLACSKPITNSKTPFQMELGGWQIYGRKCTLCSRSRSKKNKNIEILQALSISPFTFLFIPGCNSAEVGAAFEGNDLPEYPKQLNGNSKWNDCAISCGSKKACVFWTFQSE